MTVDAVVIGCPGLLLLVLDLPLPLLLPVPVLPHLSLPVVRRFLPGTVGHQVTDLAARSTSPVIGRGPVSQEITVEEIILEIQDRLKFLNTFIKLFT